MKTKTNAVASNVRKQSDKNKPFDFILFLDVFNTFRHGNNNGTFCKFTNVAFIYI